MMSKRIVLALTLVLSLWADACRRQPERTGEARPTPPSTQLADPEPDNLLNYATGAVVIDRTGEESFSSSALQAVDGDPASFWATPLRDPQQSLTVALPSRMEINRIGLSNDGGVPLHMVKRLRLESSDDARSFQPLATLAVSRTGKDQIISIAPRQLRFLRATVLEALGPSETIHVPSILAFGKPLHPARPGSIQGSWKMNEEIMQFRQAGAHFSGVDDRKPAMEVNGGTDGILYRFAWVRGAQYGLGAVAVDETGDHASGIWWFEECNPYHLGGPWFGSRLRASPSETARPATVMSSYLRRLGRFPLLGVMFNSADELDLTMSADALDELGRFMRANPRQRLRFLAHEFRSADSPTNGTRSSRQIASFRAALEKTGLESNAHEFLAAGDSPVGAAVSTRVQRSVYSTIEMQVIPTTGNAAQR